MAYTSFSSPQVQCDSPPAGPPGLASPSTLSSKKSTCDDLFALRGHDMIPQDSGVGGGLGFVFCFFGRLKWNGLHEKKSNI